MVLSNPAVLKVFALQCNLFSMGKVTVENKKTKEPIEDDPFLNVLSEPNPFGNESQFLWDFMFDAIHHRGQLSAYLRPMGGKVPSIYGPSADETGM